MGSISDEALAEHYRQGKTQCFFAQNSPESSTWPAVFAEEVASVGLRPVHYSGAGREVQASTLDDELRTDFFQSGLAIWYFGEPNQAGDYEDHWALPELRHRPGLVVFTSETFPSDLLARSGFQGVSRRVSSLADFRAQLRRVLADYAASLA